MNDPFEWRARNHNRARRVALACATFAVVSGVVVLIGWIFDLRRLSDWTNQGISMFANTALCATLAGSALAVVATARHRPLLLLARVAAAAVMAISGLTLAEHVTGVDFGIDTLLIRRDWGQTLAMAPMRMGPPASTSFAVLGAALGLATFGGAQRRFAAQLPVVTATVALLSLTGYVFGADPLFGIAKYTAIALETSLVVAALSVGAIAALPEHGLASAVSRPDAGGDVLRRLLIPIIGLPFLLGLVHVWGEQRGMYDSTFGTALRTIAEVVCFFALLWLTASSISWHASTARSAQARLAAIVESSDDAIVSKNLNGVIQSWNRGAERIFGYTAAEAVGKNIMLIIPPDRSSEEVEIVRRLRGGEHIDHFDTIRVRKDGTRIRVSLTVSPLRDESGQVVGASKIARDVTASKMAEERLRAVVNTTPECVKIVAPDGTLEFMNPGGLRMVDADDARTVLGDCVFNLIAPEHRAAWIANHERVCGGERLSWEYEVVSLKGARRWLETHAVPLPLPDGRVAHLAVTRETTARKQMERDREALLESERAARSAAERASQLKDEFLATLSHELRTPLNAILGWAQILTPESDATELGQGLDVIERNARAQTQLIEDLLDMSRIVAGKVRLDVQMLDLAPVIEAAVDSVQPAANAKEIRLKKKLDYRAGPISGDPTRLQQVVWNLLTNAIKFTPRGGTVDVKLQHIDSQIEITVADTGIGIAADELSIIFERFRQADSSSTRSYGGLGLGLSIVKQLVELHGGSVTAQSRGANEGSTFVVSLPLAPIREALDEGRPEPAGPAPSIAAGIHLQGAKVLVVDDEADARSLVQRILSHYGATVQCVSAADEALQSLTAFRPDVIVSDIGMPAADGYQFIRQVRQRGESDGGATPAIALTAFARSEDRMRSMLAGYQMHVAKPIEPQELVVAVAMLSRKIADPTA